MIYFLPHNGSNPNLVRFQSHAEHNKRWAGTQCLHVAKSRCPKWPYISVGMAAKCCKSSFVHLHSPSFTFIHLRIHRIHLHTIHEMDRDVVSPQDSWHDVRRSAPKSLPRGQCLKAKNTLQESAADYKAYVEPYRFYFNSLSFCEEANTWGRGNTKHDDPLFLHNLSWAIAEVPFWAILGYSWQNVPICARKQNRLRLNVTMWINMWINWICTVLHGERHVLANIRWKSKPMNRFIYLSWVFHIHNMFFVFLLINISLGQYCMRKTVLNCFEKNNKKRKTRVALQLYCKTTWRNARQ